MKATRFIFALAAILPVGIAEAQQQPTVPPEPVVTVLRNRTTALRRNILQALDSIPADKYSYKPTAAQQTIGFIAQHIAADSYYFCSGLADQKPPIPDSDYTTVDSVKAKLPKAELVAKVRAAFTFCDAQMANLTDAQIMQVGTTTFFTGQPRPAIRVNLLVGHAIDLADHYSQLANYMRLNNLIPPTALPRPGRGGQ